MGQVHPTCNSRPPSSVSEELARSPTSTPCSRRLEQWKAIQWAPTPHRSTLTHSAPTRGLRGDLRTSKRANFSSLYMDKLRGLQQHYHHAPERGPKTPIEDAIVGLYNHCTFDLNPRPSSIDTPLHAFVPYRHVDHTHPNAVIALAAAKHSEQLTCAIYGDEVVWTPWQRPGFDLGLKLEDICRAHPRAKGVILG